MNICTWDGKELWYAMESVFSVVDVGCELYAMEKLNDYKMVENRFVAEKIQIMAKELELLSCTL